MLDGVVGEYLGVPVREGIREVFGGVEAGEGGEAFFHELTMRVGKSEFPVTVGFSYDIAHHGFAILGQNGFFEKFTVSFDLKKDEITLKARR